MAEEERPVHRFFDVSTGEEKDVPLTDEEWAEQKQRMAESQEAERKRIAEEEELAEAVRNHDDPVVKALGRRLGII